MVSGPRILVADLERVPTWTKPLAVWDMKGLQNHYLRPDEIESWGRTICLAYREGWEGRIKFIAEWQPGGRETFLQKALALLETTDILVGHNSEAFDFKHLAGDIFMDLGKTVPKIQHLDTLKIARQNANWENNQLLTLTQRLGIPSKTDKYRIATAMGAVNGDRKAQREIRSYNIGDVEASTGLGLKLLPLSKINVGLYADDPTAEICPACSGTNLQRRGFAVKAALRYPRLQCTDCGRWSTSKTSDGAGSVAVRPL